MGNFRTNVSKEDVQAIVRGTARALRSSRDNILYEPLPDRLAMLSKCLTEGSIEPSDRRPIKGRTSGIEE